MRLKQVDFNNALNNAVDGSATPVTPMTPSSASSSCNPLVQSSATASSATGSNAVINGCKSVAIAESESVATATVAPIKLIKKHHLSTTTSSPSSQAQQQLQTPNSQQRSLQKQISAADTFISTPRAAAHDQLLTSSKTNVTLDTIITEYLTNQHALCTNPMSTCPQFDLFVPHTCPDPRPNKMSGLSLNFAGRYFRRQMGFTSRRLDRRLVHSQFAIARTLRAHPDNDIFFTCCEFTPCASSVIVGSYYGEVKVFNINENGVEYSFGCHESFVDSVKTNREGNLLITSCLWRSPLTALWNIENKQFSLKHQWGDEEYMQFSNVSQDRLLGTKAEVATIYDLHTGKKVTSFTPTIFNQYSKNRATFCPTDELILSGTNAGKLII